jgi:TatA/E family protein of Tat protein translocase
MDISPEKLLVLFVIAVLVLGPDRLPQAARTLGRGLGELRRHTSAFQSELRDVLAEPRAIVEAAAHEAEMRGQLARLGGGATPGEEGQRADVAPAAAAANAAAIPANGAGLPISPVPRGGAAPLGAPDDPVLN